MRETNLERLICWFLLACWVCVCLRSLNRFGENRDKPPEETRNVANNHLSKQTNEQIKAAERTHKRLELLEDGAVAFRASCGQTDGSATRTPYIMRPSASERGIPSNAVSRLESFIRFFAGSLEIHVKRIYGKWCLIPQRGLG